MGKIEVTDELTGVAMQAFNDNGMGYLRVADFNSMKAALQAVFDHVNDTKKLDNPDYMKDWKNIVNGTHGYKTHTEDIIDRERRYKFYKENSAELLDMMFKNPEPAVSAESAHTPRPTLLDEAITIHGEEVLCFATMSPYAIFQQISEYLEKYMQEKK